MFDRFNRCDNEFDRFDNRNKNCINCSGVINSKDCFGCDWCFDCLKC